MIVGDGEFRYELVDTWGEFPENWEIGDVPGIAVDAQDRVYVFSRSERPVMVFDRDGRFLDSWGQGIVTHAHGITITPDGFIYCTDDRDHTVRKFTMDGKLLQTVGTANRPSDTGYIEGPQGLASIKRGAGPFNRPTKVARAHNGDLYITDGYGNARVHRFSAEGALIESWGEPGDQPGQFNLPHSIWIHTDGRMFVCDRENSRVQIFSQSGEYLGGWTIVGRPNELCIDKKNVVYISVRHMEAGHPTMAGRIMTETCYNHISIRDLEGNEITRFGEPGTFASAHGICIDSRGDIYVGENGKVALSRAGCYRTDYRPLKKLVRL